MGRIFSLVEAIIGEISMIRFTVVNLGVLAMGLMTGYIADCALRDIPRVFMFLTRTVVLRNQQ